VDFHVLFPHDYPLDNGLGDLPLLFKGEVSPPAVEALRLGQDFAAREPPDGQEVDLAGKPGDLSVELLPPSGKRVVALSELPTRDVALQVEAVELVGL